MTAAEPSTALTEGPPMEDREARLAGGADRLADRQGKHPVLGNEHFLLTTAASLMTVGVSAILLGWLGAARSTLVEEQLPYLISGGLLGVSLSIVGALMLFSHWLTVAIRENRVHEAARRSDHEQLMDALRHLGGALAPEEGSNNGSARSAQPRRPVRRASSRS
jgi:hypothetical protein